jgi:uncharacterized protein YaiI (UPF0178 family)
MRTRTEIGILVFETDANVKHEQKRTFKRNRQQAALNTADHMQGARIDIKDERKQERQQERERKRIERKLNRGLY